MIMLLLLLGQGLFSSIPSFSWKLESGLILFIFFQAVYMLIFLPICGTLVLCTKLLTLIPYDTVTNIFSETEWSEFFINSNVSTCYYAT